MEENWGDEEASEGSDGFEAKKWGESQLEAGKHEDESVHDGGKPKQNQPSQKIKRIREIENLRGYILIQERRS